MLIKVLNSGTGRLILTLLGIAIVYGAINLVFVGVQNLYHSKDNAKLELLKSDLDDQLKSIKVLEHVIISQETFLEKTKRTINVTTDTTEYNRLVDKYNAELALYKANHSRYSQDLESYNKKVDESNALAKEVGSTWYLVPIPGGKH